MNKIIFSFCLVLTCSYSFAQTASDFNYSLAAKAYSWMQLPKILNQEDQHFVNTYLPGGMIKFNDKQISYRIGGHYLKQDLTFNNTCSTCEIANGTVKDYGVKIGFEKNFNYSRIQPYIGFDLGYRANRFSGEQRPNGSTFGQRAVIATKNGAVVSPVLGIKLNILPELTFFAEANMDFYYSYERQESSAVNGADRTVNTYRKFEGLANPVSAGLQFNISRKE